MALPLKPKRLVPGAIAHYAPIKNRNLIKWSEDFSNSVWTKNSTTIAQNDTIAPDGTLSADKMVETALDTFHTVSSSFSAIDNNNYVLSVYFKTNERIYGRLAIVRKDGTAVRAWFNLQNGTIGTVESGGSAYISSVGNGWYRCSLKINILSGVTTPSLTISMSINDNVSTYLGDITKSIYIWGAQLELSPSATTYQRTTDLQTLWNQKQENMSVTNIVTNGNFASTDGWVGSGCSLSAVNNTLSIIANGTLSYAFASRVLNISPTNKKIYLKTKIRTTNSLCAYARIQAVGTTGGLTVTANSITSPIQNVQYNLSGIAILDATHTGNLEVKVLHSYADAATALNKVMEVQQVLAIDLTSLFGAGNEPQTTQQCDEMFSSWFDGSIRMNLNRYNGMLGSTSAVDVNDPTFDGTGLSFGGDDYVNVGSNTALNIVNNDFTLLVICKPTTTNLESLIGKNTFTLNGWGIYQNANKFNVLIRGASAGKFVSSNSNYILNNWYIIAGRRMSNVLSLFINGNKQTSEVTIEEIVESSSNNFIIGKPVNSSLYYFNGNICNVLIYNRALTDAEIAQNYYVFRQECARLGVILP